MLTEVVKQSRDERRLRPLYYANWVRQWGVPVGIGPLTEKQRQRRLTTLRFGLKDKWVDSVATINGSGLPTSGQGDALHPELRRDSDQAPTRAPASGSSCAIAGTT